MGFVDFVVPNQDHLPPTKQATQTHHKCVWGPKDQGNDAIEHRQFAFCVSCRFLPQTKLLVELEIYREPGMSGLF